MPSILFVCFANRVRSPLAAAFFQSKLLEAGLTGDWRVQSAGTWPQAGGFMPLNLLREFDALGIHLEDHHPRVVDDALLKDQDLILTMETGQMEAIRAEFPGTRGRVFLLSEVAEGLQYDIPDPMSDPGCSFEQTARDLKALVEKGFAEICRRAVNAPIPD